MNGTVLLATMMAATGFAPTAVSATAQVFDPDSELLAEAHFDAATDAFTLIKRAAGADRPYLEYRYVRRDGTVQTGTHRGGSAIGTPVTFTHEFTAGRRITFRVCVTGEHAFHPCSGGDNGENWTVAVA